MNDLTTTAHWTRRSVKYLAVFIVVFFVLKSTIGIIAAYWKQKNPPEQTPPDVAFGQLPNIVKPKQGVYQPDDYVLETIDGSLPIMPDQARVYFVSSQAPKFLALENAKRIANSLGFFSEPEKINESLYRYFNQTDNTTLTLNPLTESLKLEYPFLKDQTLASLRLTSQENIISIANGFLGKTGKDNADILAQPAEVVLKRLTTTELVSAPSISEANIAQVNYSRGLIEEEYLIYSPDLTLPNVYVIVSGSSSSKKQVVEASYNHFFIDQEKFATYPLKPISQAWEELKQKEYLLAKIDSTFKGSSLAVRSVELGYLDPKIPTNFLQPIYIFKGDYQFVGFVPAISTEWLSD